MAIVRGAVVNHKHGTRQKIGKECLTIIEAAIEYAQRLLARACNLLSDMGDSLVVAAEKHLHSLLILLRWRAMGGGKAGVNGKNSW